MANYSQNPIADARVSQINVNANYGTEAKLWVGKGSTGLIDDILLNFDLSSIPSYAVINSATLRLFQYDGDDDWLSTSIGVAAYPILAAWTETGVKYSNCPNVWNVPSPTVTFANVISTSLDIDVKAPVGYAIKYPSICFGLKVLALNAPSSSRKEFRSREYSDAAKRPVLIIDYTANTPPAWPINAAATLNLSGTIPENTSSLTVSWPSATDAQGNTPKYDVYRNGTRVAQNLTTNSYADNIGTGNPGATYQYQVKVWDGVDWNPTTLTSPAVTKNALTKALLNHTGAIAFATTEIAMSRTAPSNTNGNTSFSYSLSCAELTVYNPTADLAANGNVLKIWRTGDAVPAGPYVKFSEIKTLLASASYNGTLTFTLATTNAYGTTSTDTEAVAVDLRTTPTELGTPSYSDGYTIAGTLRYIPDIRAVAVSWAAATDPLGTAIVYDVYYKLTSASAWTLAAGDVTGTSTTISPPRADTQLGYNVKVVARSAYGYSSEAAGATLPIDKYLRPIIKLINKVRAMESVTLYLEIEHRSSFAADLSISSLTHTKLGGAAAAIEASSLVVDFTYSEAGVFGEYSSYTMILNLQDNAGLVIGAAAVTSGVAINSYTPMLSIREQGVGINCVNDGDGEYIAKICGMVNCVADNDGNKGFYVDEAPVWSGGNHPTTLDGYGITDAITEDTDGSSVIYNYGSGILIDIQDSADTLKMYTVKIFGNSYGHAIPIDTLVQFYYYTPAGTILNFFQLNNGADLAAVKLMIDGGRLKMWFQQISAYETFVINIHNGQSGKQIKPASITNVAEPTGSSKVTATKTYKSWTNKELFFQRGQITLNSTSDVTTTLSGFATTPTILITPQTSTAGVIAPKVRSKSSTAFAAILGGSGFSGIVCDYLAIGI